MASPTLAKAARGGLQVRGRRLAALAACTVLGACAQASKPTLPQLMSETEAPVEATADGRAELMKATEYWGNEYTKNPRNLVAALSYAKNLKAMGEKKRAMAVLQQASLLHGSSRELASEYGRLALEFDQIGVAGRLLAAADDPAKPDWRVISARGTVLAKQGKYKDAIPYYEQALALAPDHPSVLSNLALAHAMNGEPKRAETMLRQAAITDRNSLKIRQNLALVLGLQGKYEEAKLLASHDMAPEAAEENADYLRRVVKLEEKTAPSSKPKQAVAKAPAKPLASDLDALSEPEDEAEREPARPPRNEAVSSVRTDGLLRGTMPAGKPAYPGQAQTPEQTPDFETTFSVAQWVPESDSVAGESAAQETASAK